MSSSKNQPLQPAGHESPSSDEDATGSFYAMHFGGDGGLLMRQGTGSPSPMALMVMRAVGQMVQRKKAREVGNNSHEGSTAAAAAAAGGSADALVSAVKSDTQNDIDDVVHDADGTGACGSHVDTAETEETKKKKKKTCKKKAGKKANKS